MNEQPQSTPATTQAPEPGRLLGRLERADRKVIAGWARNEGRPDERVELEVLIDGESAGTLIARSLRPDLTKAGIGDGAHAFWLHLPQGLSPLAEHTVRVRRHSDGAELPGSPITIPPEEEPAEPAREMIARALEAAAANASPAELDRLITFLAEQAAQLLTDPEAPLPAPQAALVQRWTEAAPAAAEPDPRPHALFVDERLPHANRDAGSNAAISHMRSLQRLGYRVDFVAEHGLAGEEAGQALGAMGITCWHAPWIASVEEVLRRMGEGLDLVYLHRFGLMQRYAALVRRWCPRAQLVYCVADLHYLRLARRVAVEAGGAMVQAGAMPDVESSEETAGLRTAELMMALAADAVLTHSSFELALLRQDVPEANVYLVPWEVTEHPTAVPFAERAGVAFVGSFGHPPNLDAALFLAEKVMPLVWEQDPSIPCLLAGSDVPAVLRAAAGSAPQGRVTVLGQVPTLSEVWDRVRLSAAPLRFGAGLKGKVMESLAAGIPCVCSPMAAEGADLPREFQGLVGDSPQALAAIIVRLHSDEPDNAAIANAGLAWVREHLSAERIDAALAAAVRAQALALAPVAAAGSPA